MTTRPPPLFYFNTITFNSGYYTIIDEAPLTESKADARYLIKTQTDTTNQLQTFNSGITFSGIINGPSIVSSLIKTENVQSTSNSIPLLIGNNQLSVNGRIDIGCNTGRNGNINIGTTQTTGTGNIVIGSDALSVGGTQNITINRPLTIGYTVFPSSINQIGGTIFVTGTSQTYSISPTGSSKNLAVLNSIPIGIYQVYYNITTAITVANAVISENITSLSDTVDNTLPGTAFNIIRDFDLLQQTRFIGYNFTKSGGGILLNTVANEVIYLNQRFIYTAGPTLTSTGHLRIVRIG